MKILNATDLKPVSASYAGDDSINIKGDNVRIETNDGYPYIKSTVMNSLVDAKTNKHSFFGMTSAMNAIDLLDDSDKIIETIGPVAISNDNTLDEILGADPQYNLVRVPLTDDQAVLFALEHYETDGGIEYYVMKYRDTAITIDPNDSDEIVYANFGANADQLFQIIPIDSETVNFIAKDGRTMKYDADVDFHFKTAQGETVDPSDLSSEFEGYNTTNKWVRYENFYAPEYSTTPSILSVDDENSISGVETNFLLNAPYESIIIDGDSATIPFDIIPTKNFKTINSELSLIPTSGVSGSDLVDFRDYRRIYTGGNQIEGYANINLGYTSDYSSVITFKGDEFTYFHFPITAPEITIQNAGLEFAGAFAGVVPEFSDRIYKKLANYEDMVWWGGGEHHGVQDGTWLCAWLSGGDGENSVWVERYYNPGEISFENALTAESGGVVDDIEFVPNSEPVQDLVSTMTLEPGAYYRYYHVGNGGFEKILESLKGITDDNLVIQLSDFTLGNVVNDESSNNNDGFISNYENADEVTLDIGFGSEEQSAILLNGNSEVQVNSSTTLNVEDDKSISSWIYSRNWQNGRSSTLFTNYYKGGDKFEYMNHGLYYSYMVPNAEFNEERFTVIPSELSGADQLIDYNDIDGVPVSVAIDLDGFQWIATYIAPTVSNPTKQTLLFKLTSSGKVLESVSINPTDFDEEVAQLLIKDDNFGYLVDVTGEAYEFDIHDIKFTGTTYSIGTDYAYINMSGNFDSVGGNVLDLDQFDDGTLCTVQNDGANGVRLHAGSTIQPPFDFQTFKHVVCDDDKYYFATTYDVSGTLRLYKFNKDDDSIVEQSAMIGGSNSINAPFVTKEAIDGVVSTVIYWVGGNQINKYYINSDGEMELVLNFATDNFIGTVNGDFSGYKLNKIINKLNGSKPYLKYSALVGVPPDARKVVLTSPAEELSDNWHYFTIVKNSDEENITLYIDGETDPSKVLSGVPEGILYLTGSMLNIGGASDGSDPLFELLGLKDRDIDGGVSEFSIFSTVLSDTDVRSLYVSKFTGNDKMEWVVNNGKKDFVEEFQNMFKFKKPGIKSQFFNVIVKNLDLTDDEKAVYEAFIRTEIVGLLPANVKMVNVIWR
jgi:hypothetical protein